MTIHEASRTLLKSPPELWAECSEAASLKRHLDQFGEIRITRLEPETAVAWEGETASGTVRLEPSGWGTRVILTAEEVDPVVTSEAAVADPPALLEPAAAMQEPVVHEPAAAEPDEPAAVPEPDDAAALSEPDEPAALSEPDEPAAAEPEELALPKPAPLEPAPLDPAPRGGFFARLRARMRGPATVVEPASFVSQPTFEPAMEPHSAPELERVAQPEPVVVEPEPMAEPEPVVKPEPVVEAEPVAEAERVAEAEPVPVARAAPTPDPTPTTPRPASKPALDALTDALDSLGMAHHRPYSRS